jgi:hypothetical protein
MDIITIAQLLKGKRLGLQTEKALQQEIEQVLNNAGVNYQREFALSKGSIIDFMIEGVGIEVKLKASPTAIFKQLLRYCQFEEVKAIILVTNKIIKLPATINKKPTLVINLGQAWL